MKKRTINIDGHSTSITLEDEFWQALLDIAKEKALSINELISRIDKKPHKNLSSAVRLFILDYYQARVK
jgi:predicted DNA-binding ribbon-helix-helix protein